MASLIFTSNVLDEGTTFIFMSWICIANGLGGFNSYLIDSREFIATPRELSFQEGRPLPPSYDEDEGQAVRHAKCFNQEVLMIHTDEDCEGLEQVQLDDYDDYILDPLDEEVDVTMDRESSSNIKVDDADDIQKDRHMLINVKRTQCKHHAVKRNQQGSRNLHNFSTGDLRAIINAGRDARNIIIARR
jgi:hypothetical protein